MVSHSPRKLPIDNFVPPNWCDIMMWAVLVGEPELAQLLWAKTKEPMRAAIMASRAIGELQDRLGEDTLEADNLVTQVHSQSHLTLITPC